MLLFVIFRSDASIDAFMLFLSLDRRLKWWTVPLGDRTILAYGFSGIAAKLYLVEWIHVTDNCAFPNVTSNNSNYINIVCLIVWWEIKADTKDHI